MLSGCKNFLVIFLQQQFTKNRHLIMYVKKSKDSKIWFAPLQNFCLSAIVFFHCIKKKKIQLYSTPSSEVMNYSRVSSFVCFISERVYSFLTVSMFEIRNWNDQSSSVEPLASLY